MAGANNIIPVLTLYQPWASFIILGWKTIETRTHDKFRSLEGKTIGIHSGQTYDRAKSCFDFLEPHQHEIAKGGNFPRGVLLGTAQVHKFDLLDGSDSWEALIDCDVIRRYGLYLANVNAFEVPIPVSGSMGIWYFDMEKKIKVAKP